MVDDPAFWAVLAGSLPAYWLLPLRARLPFLALVSFAYLFHLGPPLWDAGPGRRAPALLTSDRIGLYLLVAWTAGVYALARPGRGPVPWVSLLVIGLLAQLAWFKYLPDFLTQPLGADDVAIPLGISYFTFKLVHYAVEAGRGALPRPSFASVLAWLLLFPIYTAGPIERYDHFERERETRLRAQALAEGGTRIVHGLVKRFAIVEMGLRPLLPEPGARELVEALPALSALDLWRYLVITYLVIYLDFSAYTDIAIGASRLFGLRILENFRWPILAPNIANFWTRWHMTLAGWCRTYVYMPAIGLTRRPHLAVFATFLAIGLWHAGTANWALWGLYHAAGVSVYQRFARWRRRRGLGPRGGPFRWAGVPATFLFVAVSFVFTTAEGAGGGPRASLQLLAKLVGIDLSD